MIIDVLGSNSDGNCYILNKELLLDAGVPIKVIKKGLDFNVSGIKAALITHSHKDHSKAVLELAKMGIDCYMGHETFKEIDIFNCHRVVASLQQFRVGDYIILPFEVRHDVQCMAYLIQDTRTKEKLLFATDTYMIPYDFKGINYYLIEANYSEKILEKKIEDGAIHLTLAKRVFRSHFSVENCVEFLISQDLSQAKKIILIHLSDGNSNEKEFTKLVYMETNVDTIAAEAGMTLKLGLEPF